MHGTAINTENQDQRFRESGFTMIEAAVAFAFLAMLTAMAAQLCGAMNAQRKTLERNRNVRTAESNLMSAAMALSYERLTQARLRQIADDWHPQNLTGTWRVSVKESSGQQGPRSKRIVISYQSEQSEAVRTQPLVAWRYPIKQEAEPK